MANYLCKKFSLRPNAQSQYIRYDRRRQTDRRQPCQRRLQLSCSASKTFPKN